MIQNCKIMTKKRDISRTLDMGPITEKTGSIAKLFFSSPAQARRKDVIEVTLIPECHNR